MCLIALGIVVRIFYIQTIESENWTKVGESYVEQVRSITPSRGQIYSEQGSLLATSVPMYSIYWDSKSEGIKEDSLESNLPQLASNLSALLKDRSSSEYRILLLEAKRQGKRYQLIKKKVDYLTVKELKKSAFIKKGPNRSGFIFERVDIRMKPFGMLGSRTIGIDRKGSRVGLELAYNKELSGVEGKQLQQRLPGNVWKPISNEYLVEPIEGMDVVSSIDIHLQDVASHALEDQLIKHGAAWGTVILMEVETGFIKAVANLSLNEESQTYSENFNLAIAQSIEPGSTFKLPSLMAAMDDGLLQLEDSIDTGDGIHYFYDKPMKDSNYKSDGSGGHGMMSMEEVF